MVVVAGVWLCLWSYQQGYKDALVAGDHARAAAELRLAQAAQTVRLAEASRLAAEAARAVAAQQLEDMANADPHGGNIALGADSVRRLNRR